MLKSPRRSPLTVGAILMIAVVGGCTSDDDSDVRTFDLQADPTVDEAPEQPAGLGDSTVAMLQAVIVEAPEAIGTNEDFEYTVELRNPFTDAVLLSPCPWWTGGFGESAIVVKASGQLPCDDIVELKAGERIRFDLALTAPSVVVVGEGDTFADLAWVLADTDVRAGIPLPMGDD